MMRSKKKRKPSLKSFIIDKTKLLHSFNCKSTYFCNNDGGASNSCLLRKHFINEFRWASSHREQDAGDVRMHAFTNRTQPSREINSYNKMLCGGVSYLVPCVCSIALLLVLGMMLNPVIGMDNSNKSYALEGEDVGNIERMDAFAGGGVEKEEAGEIAENVEAEADGISELNDAMASSTATASAGDNAKAATTSIAIDWDVRDPDEQETYGNSGEVLYRYNRFTLSATKIKQYQILVNAASGSSNKLVGYLDADHTMPLGVEINGITNANGVTGSNIPLNQWGYALTAGDVTSAGGLAGLTYKAVPNASDSTIALTGTEETLNSKQFTVAFGANVGNENPSGHYTTYVQVSAVMEPKPLIETITYMQDMTPEVCASMPEADTSGNGQYQLVDKRDDKTYWVARLKDGNCWMTQNLEIVNKTITSNDSDITEQSFTIGTTPLNMAFLMSSPNSNRAYSDSTYGGYYNWHTATAGSFNATLNSSGYASGSICPRGWTLPTGWETGQFLLLLGGLSASTITDSPYNYLKGGMGTNGSLNDVGSSGYYWSSFANENNTAFYLGFSKSIDFSNSAPRYVGMNVRCIAH